MAVLYNALPDSLDAAADNVVGALALMHDWASVFACQLDGLSGPPVATIKQGLGGGQLRRGRDRHVLGVALLVLEAL